MNPNFLVLKDLLNFSILHMFVFFIHSSTTCTCVTIDPKINNCQTHILFCFSALPPVQYSPVQYSPVQYSPVQYSPVPKLP